MHYNALHLHILDFILTDPIRSDSNPIEMDMAKTDKTHQIKSNNI